MTVPYVAISCPDPARNENGGIWYDGLVRTVDFLAWKIAAWNFERNLVDDKPKYAALTQRSALRE
jgi:hypothetical protein